MSSSNPLHVINEISERTEQNLEYEQMMKTLEELQKKTMLLSNSKSYEDEFTTNYKSNRSDVNSNIVF